VSGWRAIAPWLQAQAGGLLLGLAFAVDGGGWLAWPAMWLLVAGLDRRSGWERLGDGSLAGVWAASLAVGPWFFDAARAALPGGAPEALLLTGGVLAMSGAVLATFAWLWPWLPAPRWLSGPAAWTLLEIGRTACVGGVPWALLGHTQAGWPALAQLAMLGGVPLISFVVAMPGMALADHPARRRRGVALAAMVVASAAVFGTVELRRWAAPIEHGMRLRGVSGGHLSTDRDVAYLAATTDGPRADLVVWPAHAVPGVLQDEPGALMPVAAAVRRQGPLLFGMDVRERGEAGPRYFDTAILLDASASMRGRYDKRRLVPFADRAANGARLTAGEGRGIPLVLGALRIGPLLGWESLFPDLSRWWAAAGADVLVAMMDAEVPGGGGRQLIRQSAFRAIETRRWLLRVSGTGRTVTVDPAGRRWRREVIEIAPGAARPRTLFMRLPRLVPEALVGLLVALGVLALGRRRA
jgi:apolipoprotein N-acyltransferase